MFIKIDCLCFNWQLRQFDVTFEFNFWERRQKLVALESIVQNVKTMLFQLFDLPLVSLFLVSLHLLIRLLITLRHIIPDLCHLFLHFWRPNHLVVVDPLFSENLKAINWFLRRINLNNVAQVEENRLDCCLSLVSLIYFVDYFLLLISQRLENLNKMWIL